MGIAELLLQLIFINILPDVKWPEVGWCQNMGAAPQ